MTRWLCAVLIFFFAMAAHGAALTGGPTRGLWWNPAESGRGFNIEMQDDVMIVTSFVYAPNGSATWFISAGRYDFATSTFTATFDANTGGQCIGCAYVRPQGIANAAGPVRIVFDSYVTATLYYQGGSTRITKQLYAYDTTLSILRGSFVLTFKGSSGIVIGDWLVMRTYESNSNGPFVAGYFDGFPTSRIAVALYDAATRRYAFLVRVGSYYDFYIVDMDDQRVFGLGWTYLVGGSPSGNGSPALGTRVQSPREVNAEYARATPEGDDGAGQAMRAEAYARSKREGPADAGTLALARQLEGVLETSR